MTELSIVIPMRNEAAAVAALIAEIFHHCAAIPDLEVIVVDDGSTDATAAEVQALMPRHHGLRLLSHKVTAGQSAAIHSGVLAARSELVCMLDGDGQNPPVDLARLYAPLMADSTGRIGLVAGQRLGRKDRLSKRLASRLANGIRSWILADGTRDTGCGLKGFRRDAFLALPYFNHMHRYLPALFRRDGWTVVLVDVGHRERRTGASKYNNLQRGLVGLYDLVGVSWLIRRRKTAHAVEIPGRTAQGDTDV